MRPEQLKVEQRLTGYMFAKASRAGIPLSGTFELTPVCNFDCRMCYVRKTAEEVRKSERNLMTYEQWLTVARQAREAGMLYLLLTGGEPLLWPDFWKLYEELVRMGFLVSINTNGSLIDEAVAERFRALPPARINITLYGAGDPAYERLCRVKGMFSRVDRAIGRLREAGIMVKLNGSLTPHNAADLEACVSYAKEKGLIYEPVTYMFPPLRRDPGMTGKNDRFTPQEAAYWRLESYRLQFGDELYQKYLADIRKGYTPPPGLDESCVDPRDGRIRCRAGKASFWITWDGWMTPCGMMPEPKLAIESGSFGEVWTKMTELCEVLALSGICTKCSDRMVCHSCAAMAMAETGDVSGIPVYLCETVKELHRIAEEENE